MKLRISGLLAIATFVLLGSAQSRAQNAYITNGSNSVSVIDTATNTVIATVPVGSVGGEPFSVAVSPNGGKAYLTNTGSGTVSVIDTEKNAVSTTITVVMIPLVWR
jgi:YVTN family beta-propeller protein